MKTIHILLLCGAVYVSGNALVVANWNSQGDDFAPIYTAARLVADGKTSSLYDRHSLLFDVVPPGGFKETADRINFKGFLHAYVHLPLVSLLCRPLLWIPYHAAVKCLLVANYCAVMLSLLLILRLVSGERTVLLLSISLLGMAYFSPLKYGMWLGQTSPLVLLGITCSYYLYQMGYAKVSGCILGGIISFKIIPAFLLCYFLIKKSWSLIIASICTLMVIGIASILLLGWETNAIFFQNITTLSGYSLASWNNQSLDGLLLRWVMDASNLFTWRLLPLTFEMKIVRYFALVTVLAVWFIMLTHPPFRDEGTRDIFDFSFTLIVMLFVSPVTWSHYLLFLVFPYIIIVYTLIKDKTVPYAIVMGGGVVLSYVTVAFSPLFLPAFTDHVLVGKVSLKALSSLGFLGEVLLLIIFPCSLLKQGKMKIPHCK